MNLAVKSAVQLKHKIYMQKRPVVLIIRDGWGVSPKAELDLPNHADATLLAKTPVQNTLIANYPWAFLTPSGEAVGLPAGQMGNSEVGHLNLGAGRIVYQDLTRINLAIRDGSFFKQQPFLDIANHVKQTNSRLHLMGLCSDGGVHSHIEHIFAILKFARNHEIHNVLIHCFTDGRDTSPTSGAGFVSRLKAEATKLGVGEIVSVIGRYFAMDRDNRWERVSQAYNALVNGVGRCRPDAVLALEEWYKEGKTDEFIPPTLIAKDDQNAKAHTIKDGDGVVFFNFRSDRARELTRSLTDQQFHQFERGILPKIKFVCMTQFDETFHLPIAFPPQRMTNLLSEVLSQHNLKQLHIAETEKYPHVTFFFNGGIEKSLPGEDRKMIPSPKVATYDLKPEMSAYEITEEVIRLIKSQSYDVIILNFANPDMVGHTGSISATIRAVEVTDDCVGKVLKAIQDVNGVALVTADHGNAEKMLDENGMPHTAHTTNPVHIFYVGQDSSKWKVRDGILADVAPTILALLGIQKPIEMTGSSLLLPV
jgi:2,3-bisphosphoglycerate-independent phosphoglycerate mutase